mgnify:FL=1
MSNKIEVPSVCVLKFEATWCGPCKEVQPYIDDIKKKYTEIKIVPVDADENKELCEKYSIKKLPTFLFINGKKVTSVVGTNRQQLDIEFSRLSYYILNQNNIPSSEESRVPLVER